MDTTKPDPIVCPVGRACLALQSIAQRGRMVLTTWAPAHKLGILLSSGFVVIALFVFTRLAYFLDYPLPGLQPDYGGYWAILWEIRSGRLPIFDYRTPGFPMFMELVLLLSGKLMAVVAAQTFLTLCAALALLYSAWRVHYLLAPVVAVAATAATTSYMQVQVDMSLLTESLFGSCLLVFCALLIRMAYGGGVLTCASTSAVMALAIYVRPTGQFFLVIFPLVVLYLIRNRVPWRRVIGFGLPFLLLMLALPTYNYFSFGSFVLTNGGPISLVVGTANYWVQDESFPPEVNAGIARVQSRLDPEDRQVILESWDLRKLQQCYYLEKYWQCDEILGAFGTTQLSREKLTALYSAVAWKAIRRNYPVFLKVLVLNMYLYFYENFSGDASFYTYLEYLHDHLCIRRDFAGQDGEHYSREQRQHMLREFYNAPAMVNFRVVKRDGVPTSELKPTLLQRTHGVYGRMHARWFRGSGWVTALFGIFAVSSFLVVRRGFAHAGTFVLWILGLSSVGHGLLCSVVSNTNRFSTPMWFMYYLVPALLPLLWMPSRKQAVAMPASGGPVADGPDGPAAPCVLDVR